MFSFVVIFAVMIGFGLYKVWRDAREASNVAKVLNELVVHARFYGENILPTLENNAKILPEVLRLRSEFNTLFQRFLEHERKTFYYFDRKFIKKPKSKIKRRK